MLRRAVYFPWVAAKAARRKQLGHFLRHRDYLRPFDYAPSVVRFMEETERRDLLLECPLSAGAVVVDVGAFDGEWAATIRKRYDARVFAFEPSPAAFAALSERLGGDPGVRCIPFGLGAADERQELALAGPGASVFFTAPGYEAAEKRTVEIRDVKRALPELGLERIDLLKVNIEGGEYDLLDRMIEARLLRTCRCIRIQFHRWIPGAARRRRRIRRSLARSHRLEWDYAWAWESWVLRDPDGPGPASR